MIIKPTRELRRITSVEFRGNFSENIEKSIRTPVVITRRNRPMAVVLYYEDYEHLIETIRSNSKSDEE